MRCFLPREELLRAVQRAGGAVPTKNVKPVLLNVRLTLADGAASLEATDMEIGVRLPLNLLEADGAEPGACLLPAAKLRDILREATDEQVELEAGAESVTLRGTATGATFELPTGDPAEFPSVPGFPDGGHVELRAGALADLLRQTSFACADEAARFSMTGCLFDVKGDTLTVVGTDGRRLACATGTVSVADGGAAPPDPVVPSKAIGLLQKVMDDPEAPVRVALRANEVTFQTGGAVAWSRLVEGRYPAWRQVLEPAVKNAKHRATAVAGGLFHAVKLAGLGADKDTPRVTFAFAAGGAALTAQGATAGRSRVVAPLAYDGPALNVNLNHEFVAQALAVLPPDGEVEVLLTDHESPVVFRAGESWVGLVMVMV